MESKKCKKCKIEKDFSSFYKEKKGKYGLKNICIYCHKETAKEYYEANKQKIKEYYENNKEKINEYSKERRKNNPLFKLTCNLRSRTCMAFKNKGYSKKSKTKEMLGVDWKTTKAHIERQFTKGMNWDNQGEWHIDHIIPLSSAKTEQELIKLCHYRNLQPLWEKDNLEKSNKMPNQQIQFKI